MKILLTIAACLLNALCLARAGGTPKIQFTQTEYNFGKTSLVENVSGTFRFKNVGDGVLKLDPPHPTCGCTIADLKSDTLKPGETGDLAFTLNLGHSRAALEKHISVKSNDPQTPEVTLTILVDYTPLYELTPTTLGPDLAFGVNETVQSTTLARTDGKPLRIARLDASKPWITPKVEPGVDGDGSKARIRIAIRREGPPRRFNEYIHIYTTEQTNIPVSTIYLYGNIMGQISVNPETLYWSISEGPRTSAERPEAMAMRRITIRSANEQPFEVKHPQSTLSDIQLELVPDKSGKVYELVATLKTAPAQTLSGTVSFETSVASQPKIEVPVIVNVFKPSPGEVK